MTPRAFALLLAAWSLATTSWAESGSAVASMPWRQAGLTERQAAAHLLDRFAFGARPGEIDRVVAMGLEVWLTRQLAAAMPEGELDHHLADLDSLKMSSQEIGETYFGFGQLVMKARRAQEIGPRPDRGTADVLSDERLEAGMHRKVREFARQEGLRPLRQLYDDMLAQKILRAAYAENSLVEVLTDFWFNHFNVSVTNTACRQFVLTYERDAIRPHVLGSFRQLLGATAHHPAMLLYLDNARSVATAEASTTLEKKVPRRLSRRLERAMESRRREVVPDTKLRRFLEERRPKGLNENYARELLELHTLGVDGGYSQEDVVEVARAFSGWTTWPPGIDRERLTSRRPQARRLGFVFAEDFIFRSDAHDAGAKTVLGHRLPAGRGLADGEEVLDLLAAHPATARHLARKLATRFVADEPPAALVERLAQTCLRSGGQLREMLVTLVESPEFWAPGARRQKIKSPFELAVSALRGLGATVDDPRRLAEWIARMGQPLYAYQAPTGYPDRAETWVNTGSLLNRMNFGLQLAAGQVRGAHVDLVALNSGREPESLLDALETYVPLLLPERDPRVTIQQLEPVIRDPDLALKVARATPQEPLPRDPFADDEDRATPQSAEPEQRAERIRALAQVVGVILGSPEFQRR